MRHYPFLLILLLACFFDARGQWTRNLNAPFSNLHGIESYNNSFIYAGGNSAFIRTLNGGTSWDSLPLIDNFGTPILGSSLYSVHFTSPSTGVATGSIVTANSEVILQTTNGGANWTLVSTYNGGSWPRLLNKVFFASSSVVYAAGSNGRILKSTNGGSSWSSQSSGTSVMLYDISFITTNTGYVAGDQRILKTINGGSTWTSQSLAGKYLKAIFFPAPLIGYAAGDNGVLLKTTNGGTTWQDLPVIPGSPDFTDIHFISQDTGFAAAGSMICRTTDGGMHWEKFMAAGAMNGVSFSSPGVGWACGDNGLIYHTTNGGNPYYPIADFSISPAVLCDDSLVQFVNQTDSSCTFSWLFNGQLLATTYGASVIDTSAGQADTITLVANNGFNADTMTRIFQVQPSLRVPIQADLSQDTLCSGQSTQVNVYNSVNGVSYQLRRRFSAIGTPKTGNFGTLTFNTGIITADDTLNILATRFIAGCGSDTSVIYLYLTIGNANASLQAYAGSDTLCPGQSTNIFLLHSEPGVVYQLKRAGLATGSPQTGNGDTLLFNTGAFFGSSVFTISATSAFGCLSTLNQSVNITIEDPHSYFTLENYNPEVGSSIYTINRSINPSGSYQWNFGPAATPQNSTAMSPSGIIFSSTGDYTVRLVSISAYGCRDTLTRAIHIISPFAVDSCRYTQDAVDGPNAEMLVAIDHDYQGNLITLFNAADETNMLLYSNHSDTIAMQKPYSNTYNVVHCLSKLSPKGVPVWTLRLLHNSPWAKQGDLETDSAGNIYCTFFHGDDHDSVRIYSSDNSFITILPPWNGSSMYSAVVIKYNKDGIYQWHNTFLTTYTNEQLTLKLDAQANLYASANSGLVKFDSNGQLLWSVTPWSIGSYDFADLEIDHAGNAWVTDRTDLIVHKFDPAGSLLFSTPTITTLPQGVIASGFLALDEDDNLYVAGTYRGRFIFAGDTVPDPSPGGPVHEDVFVCKMRASGQQEWIRIMHSDAAFKIKGLAYKENHLLLLVMNEGDTVYPSHLVPLPAAHLNHFIYHCDTLGNTESAWQLYKSPGNLGGLFLIQHHLVSFSKINNEVALAFVFDSSFQFNSGTVQPCNKFAINVNDFIGRGPLACLIPNIPTSTSTPVSYFTFVNDPACIGSTVQYTDWSGSNPTGWNWQFPGGVPSTSSVQHPAVVYPAAGTYPVSLVASNGNGQGTVFSDSVHILAYPNVSITGDPDVCPGDQRYYTASGASTYLWNTGGTGPLIFVTATTSTVYTVTGTVAPGCSDTATFSVTVFPYPSASIIIPNDTLCLLGGPVPLSAIPSGGTFSGIGVSGNTFDPAVAGLSFHDIYYRGIDSNGCIARDTLRVFVTNCLGIHSLQSITNNYRVSPVPVSDVLTIESTEPDYMLTLTNANGKIILREQVRTDKTELNVSNLSDGIYYLEAHGLKQVRYFRIPIIH